VFGRRSLAQVRGPFAYRDFRLLWLAQLASELGDWSARLAVAVLVLDRTGSPALSAFSFTVSILPSLTFGPYLAAIGDRRSRRSVLVALDLIRACIYGFMALPLPTWALFPLLFLAATATPPFEAVRSALLPTIVREEHYADAVMISGVTQQSALLVGYLAGGGLVAVVGARSALAVNAASFLVSGILIARLAGGRDDRVGSGRAHDSLKKGLRFVLDDDVVRRTTVLICAIATGGIVAETLAPAYAQDVLGRGAGAAGLLSAAVPLGTIAAGVWIRRTPIDRALTRMGAVAVAAATVAAVAYLLDPSVPWVIVPFVAVGVVFGAGLLGNVVLGRSIPDEMRSSAFGLLQAVVLAVQGLGALVGGLAAQFVGVRAACVGGCVFVVVTTLREAVHRPNRHAP
jgi:MFS family permease